MRIGADDPEMGARIVDAYEDQGIPYEQEARQSGSRSLFYIVALLVMCGLSIVILAAVGHLAYDLARFGWRHGG